MSGEMQGGSAGKEIAKGIASCLALNLLHFGIACLSLWFANDFDIWFVFGVRLIVWFGVVQFVYVLPLVFVLRKSRPNVAKGMVIWACVIFLLCAACWGSLSFISGGHDTPWTWSG